MLRFSYILITLFLLVFSCVGAQAMPSNLPPLHKGINLSSWFANAPMRQPLGEADFQKLSNLGFDYVRLPVNPVFIGFTLDGKPDQLEHLNLKAVDRAIDGLMAHHLTVILDIHPEADFKDEMEKNPIDEDKYIALWKVLAKHYKSFDRQNLLFESINEPEYYNKSRIYNSFAARIVKAIRESNPDRLIVVGTPSVFSFKPLDAIQSTEILSDANIIYATHYYQPYIISHQGMPFGFEDKQIPFLRHVAYPANLAKVEDIHVSAAGNEDKAKREVEAYIAQGWNKDKIRSYLKPAADYAKEHDIRLLVLEFGVYRPHIDEASRYRWIKDTREVMDELGLGWAYWDYNDIFGIVHLVGDTVTNPRDGSVKFKDSSNLANHSVIDSGAYEALSLTTEQ